MARIPDHGQNFARTQPDFMEDEFERGDFYDDREDEIEREDADMGEHGRGNAMRPDRRNVSPEIVARMDEIFVQINAARELTLEQLEDAREYFSPLYDEYEHYDTIKNVRIPRFISRFDSFIIWGVILLIIGLAVRFLMNFLNKSELFSTILQAFPTDSILKIAKLFIIIGIVLICIKVIYEIIRLIVILISRHSLNNIKSDLMKSYKASPFVGTIGFDYSDPFILEEMIKIVRDGRANTLPEAINAYEISRLTNDD